MTLEARFRLPLHDFALDVDLQLPAAGVSALIGPSGAGKTTLLRCIAGLERARVGRVTFRGEVWQRGASRTPGSCAPTNAGTSLP